MTSGQRRRAQFLRRAADEAASPRPSQRRQPSTITGIATGCASASRTAARRRSPTTNCSSCCCSARSRAPTPSRSPRRCWRGSARSPKCSARRSRCCRRSRASARRWRSTSRSSRAAGQRWRAERDQGPRDPVVVEQGGRLLPGGDGLRGARAVPHPVPRQEERADRRRGAADRHGRPHAGLSARGRAPRARTVGDARSCWSTTIRQATRPRRAPTSR